MRFSRQAHCLALSYRKSTNVIAHVLISRDEGTNRYMMLIRGEGAKMFSTLEEFLTRTSTALRHPCARSPRSWRASDPTIRPSLRTLSALGWAAPNLWPSRSVLTCSPDDVDGLRMGSRDLCDACGRQCGTACRSTQRPLVHCVRYETIDRRRKEDYPILIRFLWMYACVGGECGGC